MNPSKSSADNEYTSHLRRDLADLRKWFISKFNIPHDQHGILINIYLAGATAMAHDYQNRAPELRRLHMTACADLLEIANQINIPNEHN